MEARAGVSLDVLSDGAIDEIAAYEAWAIEHPATYLATTEPCMAPSGDLVADRAYLAAVRATREFVDATIGDHPVLQEFQVGARWTRTATDADTRERGAPVTLTWSYLPDGVVIETFGNDPPASSPSVLISFLSDLLGGPTTPGDYTTAPWHDIFVVAFANWSAATGVNAVYEPNDDGARFPVVAGALGVRGDVRIGANRMGSSRARTLAYNYFPDFGDMVLNVDQGAFYAEGLNDVTAVNIIAHELGHGLGFSHVDPVDRSKLMEPFINTGFFGIQEDDRLAGHRNYGDYLEEDDTPATAFDLPAGAVGGRVLFEARSIDGAGDVDYVSLTVAAPSDIDITVQPTGTTYQQGPQNGFTAPFDALVENDLQVRLLLAGPTPLPGAAAAAPVLVAEGNATSAGQAEGIQAALAPGTYLIEVSSQSGADVAQLYDLEFQTAATAAVPVTLVAFDAQSTDCAGNEVRWTTASELDNDRFVVLRSAFAEDWTPVAEVAAAGAGEYVVVDEGAPAGASYYKLVQYDLDGTMSEFPVVQVERAACAEALVVSPNPSSGVVSLAGVPAGAEVVSVYDAMGREVFRRDWRATPGALALSTAGGSLDLGHLAAGLYRVVARHGRQVTSGSVVLR